jgi:ABC-2 type transport system permease protein
MRALLGVLGFELRQGVRRISTWVYFAIFAALAFVLTCAAGGAWGGFDLGMAGQLVNSPVEIASTVALLTLLGMPVTAALLGNAVYRDFGTGMHPLVFTTPVPRAAYLVGRYAGAVLVNLLVFLGVPLGILLGSLMPTLQPDRVGATLPAAYLQAFLLFPLPNVVFAGALLFGLAALTRHMLPNYIGGVLLLVGYAIGGAMMARMDSRTVAAMLDPFGIRAQTVVTQYWTLVERNTLFLPADGVLLYNRLLWMAVGGVALLWIWSVFRFEHPGASAEHPPPLPVRRVGAVPGSVPRPAIPSAAEIPSVAAASPTGPAAPEVPGDAGGPLGTVHPATVADAAPTPVRAVPPARRDFGARARLRQGSSLSGRAFREIVGSVHFVALVAVGLIFLIGMATQVGKAGDVVTFPVTYAVLEALTAGFILFMVIIITVYAGELVWRERDLRLHGIHDALPIPTALALVSRFVALAGVVALLLGVILLFGILTQLSHGYTRFEIGQYLRELFVHQYAMYLQLCVLAFAVHVLVNHKYLGHLIMVVYYVGTPLLYLAGLEHNLLHFGGTVDTTYSDMNGYGHALVPWLWFNVYWGAFCVLLAVVTGLFQVRGEETHLAWRARLARGRFTPPVRAGAAAAALLFLATGGWTFYNTNVLNEYTSSREGERGAAEYERRYKRFEHLPQPRITAVTLDVAIFPDERDLVVRGEYRLRNRTDVPIDSVYIDFPSSATHRDFRFDRPAAAALEDDPYGFHVYALGAPLLPGDSLTLHWEIEFRSRGFANDVAWGPVVGNGTFVHNTIFPGIGYNPHGELADDDARRRHGLAPRPRAALLEDEAARHNNDIARDADWIDFDVTLSTSADQIAMAPGYLQREWTEGGRRFFHYRMDAPILNFHSYLSARYAVRRDVWRAPPGAASADVAIEILYHPTHGHNVDRMIDATRKSLAYFTREFGPYPHRQVRILEFPRYASFAQSFPNTIPFSEALGFIMRVREGSAMDHVFLVTAHEVAHQWWGHQAVGAGVQGSALISESLAEYAALMVMEQEIGAERMRPLLLFNLDGYLRERTGERRGEMPLLRVENQPYIHYQKGGLVMYALRHYLGEERLNGALRAFLERVRFQEPPYTTSLELYEHLRAAAPDSLHPLLADMFEHVTLYDNRVLASSFEALEDGRFRVTLEVEARKLRVDDAGHESEVEMDDPVEIGVFGTGARGADAGTPLYLGIHRIRAGRQTVVVEVDGVPVRAGIDPMHRLIDRRPEDNLGLVRRGAGR